MTDKKEGTRYIEIKGTQIQIGLSQAKKIAKKGTRDGIMTCAPISPKAKAFFEEQGIYYVENVPLEDVMNYDISIEQ
jgi:hypothetical protein